MKALLFIIICCACFAFDLRDNQAAPLPLLEDCWVLESYEVETTVYSRQNSFDKDKPGICFLKGGKLLKRQNSGWCGTPPITYTNNEGTWELSGDSTIRIRYKFWGGTAEEEWQITSLDDKRLNIKSLSYKNDRDKDWEVKEPQH